MTTLERSPLRELKRFCAGYGTQVAAAKALGISQPYLSDLLRKRRDVSKPLLKKLGLKRAVIAA